MSKELFNACLKGYLDEAHRLISEGADVNYRSNMFGWTPLMIASGCGYADIVRLLLKRGAHFYYEDDDGFTPLAWASQRGHVNIVCLLKMHVLKEVEI